jgi:hypothetical protein
MCQSCYYLTCSVSIAVHLMSSKLQIEKQLLFSLIGCRYKYLLMSFDKKGKRSLDQISVDRNCVLSLDLNYVNHLIEFFDTFHLIELFDQLIKRN